MRSPVSSRARRAVVYTTVACFAASVASAAPKGPPAPTPKSRAAAARLADVDSAEKYYGNMDYESANAIAGRVLDSHGLTHDQMERALRIVALTYATLGKPDQARDAFTTLLEMDPEFQLDPNLSPRVTTPFLEARGYWRGQTVKPGLEVVATVHSTDSATLVVTTRDPTHVVANVSLGYRWGANGPFTTRPVAIGDTVNVQVPSSPSPSEGRLDYYVQGLDEREDAIFEVGSPTAPRSAMVDAPVVVAAPVVASEKPGGQSVFASPYFWTAAAVVVAGAAVGGFLLFRPKAPDGATLTSGAECGANPCR